MELGSKIDMLQVELRDLWIRLVEIELELRCKASETEEIVLQGQDEGGWQSTLRQARVVGDALVRVSDLSDREKEVFELLAEGASNRTLSSRLRITERTVKAHVAQILNKLGLQSRAQAGVVAFAFRMRLQSARKDWTSAMERAVLSK